jgi:predicted DNA-binding protein
MSVQISAYIQDDVKNKLEAYSCSHGMKKGFLIENAIEYYLQALHELPSNVIVPSSLVITKETFDAIEHIESNQPTQKLKELMA